MSVKKEGHGHHVTRRGYRGIAVNVLKNVGYGFRVRLTGGIHYLMGQARSVGVIGITSCYNGF